MLLCMYYINPIRILDHIKVKICFNFFSYIFVYGNKGYYRNISRKKRLINFSIQCVQSRFYASDILFFWRHEKNVRHCKFHVYFYPFQIIWCFHYKDSISKMPLPAPIHKHLSLNYIKHVKRIIKITQIEANYVL